MSRLFLFLLFTNLFNIVQSQVPPNVPIAGLIAFYPFNGNVNNAASTLHSGTSLNITGVADRFGSAPGLEKKEVCFVAAPIPQYFTSLAEHLPADQHAVLLLVAPHSEAGMRDMVAQHGGQITYRKTADEVAGSHKTLLEYTWNHTTLHALKVDKGLTYIQSGFNPMHRLKQVKALEAALKGEVMMHLEFLRTKEGAFNCSGLQIIRYTTEERLNQIMQIYRDHGVQINNPHVYIVEDGKQNNLDPAVVQMKHRFDPQGLLNPGKLRSWMKPDPTPQATEPVPA